MKTDKKKERKKERKNERTSGVCFTLQRFLCMYVFVLLRQSAGHSTCSRKK